MGFFLFSREEREDHVNNREVLDFAIGLAGQNISYGFISSRLVYFYENHMMSKARQHWVGKFMTATYIWDAINDVLVGGIVDKRRHKPLQKMRPYLLYMPPFIGLLSALMFVNINLGDLFKIVWLAVLYCAWDLLYSFQDVALWGLLPLSTPHPGDRSRIAHWVTVGAGAGGTVAGAFPLLLGFLRDSLGFREAGIFTVFAFVFGLGGELVSMDAARFRERVDSPYHEEESFLQSLTIVRHNPTLIFISLARFSLGLAPKINQMYFFQSEYRGEVSGFLKGGGLAETLYGVVSGAPGAIALLFAGKIIPLFGGMKKTLIVSQITAIGMRLAAFGLSKIPALHHSTVPGFLVMCACVAVFNIPGGLMDVAHRSLTSDSVDEVELKTGIRSEGVSFSMQNFTTKFSGGVSNLIQNFFLFHVLHYAKEEGDDLYIDHQPPEFYKWQYPLFMLGPIVGSVLYILFISFVKDSEDRRREVERLLRERREAAAVHSAVGE